MTLRPAHLIGGIGWGRTLFPAVVVAKDPWTSLRLNVEHGHRAHFHGSCARPVEIHLVANFASWDGAMRERLINLITARCRKCEPCRKAFYWHWHQRTMLEMARATRSLLVTLTFATEPTTDQVYYETRNYVRRARLWAERNGYENTKLRMLFVIQRGDQGSQRLHVHMLICELGVPLPDDVYNNPLATDRQGKVQYPRGQWFAGWASVRPITHDPPRAAGYVLRYCLRDAVQRDPDAETGAETLPGGRRLAASTFWGPGKPVLAHKAPPTERCYTARQWVADLTAPHRNLACEDPLAPGRGDPEQTARALSNCPSCALAIKSQEHANQRGPPDTPLPEWLTAISLAFGETNATMRVLDPDEIPPEVARAWNTEDREP